MKVCQVVLPWTRDRIFLLKDPITVGCQRKNPKHMRSNKGRTCVGKAIIGKRQIIVIFAVLDILQLVIQHCSGNCLTAIGQGHVDNTTRIQYKWRKIFKLSFCVVLLNIVWYSMVFPCIDTLIEVIFKSFASFSSVQCKLNYTVNDTSWLVTGIQYVRLPFAGSLLDHYRNKNVYKQWQKKFKLFCPHWDPIGTPQYNWICP